MTDSTGTHQEGIDHIKSNISGTPETTGGLPGSSTIGSGSAAAGWKQEGEGPHSTLAGNRFDPSVGSEPVSEPHSGGILGSVKNYLGYGSAASTQPSEARHADEATPSSGLTSGTAEPMESSTTQEPLVSSGRDTAVPLESSTTTEPLTSSSRDTAESLESSSTTEPGMSSARDTAELPEGSATGAPVSSMADDTTHGSMGGLNTEQKDPMASQGAPRSLAGETSSKPDDPTTGGMPTATEPDTTPATKEEIGEHMEGGSTREGMPTETEPDTTPATKEEIGEHMEGGSTREGGESTMEHEKKMTDAELGSKRMNEGSIPTAGGERLGKQHWGESKIVPDNPKKEEEKGVASAEGQPTDQVRDNTHANTGGAAPPGEHAHGKEKEGKESLADKIKDKLHIGKK